MAAKNKIQAIIMSSICQNVEVKIFLGVSGSGQRGSTNVVNLRNLTILNNSSGKDANNFQACTFNETTSFSNLQLSVVYYQLAH